MLIIVKRTMSAVASSCAPVNSQPPRLHFVWMDGMTALRYSEKASAEIAMRAEKPAKKETQPVMNPQVGPYARVRYTYSPPELGKFTPSSEKQSAPASAATAPTTQMSRNRFTSARSPATKPGAM